MRRWLRFPGAPLIIMALAVAAHLAIVLAGPNFHEVVPRLYYRSAQPTAAELAAWQRDYGIRSVVNLRGAAPGAPWYDRETAAAARLGLTHLDLAWSAGRDVTPAEAGRLLAALRDVPKPVLVHCKSGADRTGLATALYLAAVAHWREPGAEAQLGLRYGHVGLPLLSRAWAMDRSWEALEALVGYGAS